MKKKTFKFNRDKLVKIVVCFISVLCLSFGSLAVFASDEEPTVYYANISQPQLTGNDCYLEVVTANNWRLVIYAKIVFTETSSVPNMSDISFECSASGDYLNIYAKNISGYAVNIYSWYYDIRWNSVGSLSQENLAGEKYVSLYLGNSGAISGIHCYNCEALNFSGVNNDFVFSYGVDTVFKNQIDKVISLLEQNKSSAENNDYSGVTAEQQQSQTELNDTEQKIYSDTAEYRDSTISIFKNFKIVGSIANGMLAVTHFFDILTSRVSFASPLLQFSLAVGLGGFLLGVSSIIFKIGKK